MIKGKAKTLTNGPAGRWLKGEVGILLQCDFDKYDYCVDFGTLKDQELFGEKINFRRVFYFYEDQIEIVPDNTPTTRIEVITTTIQTLRLKGK